MALRRTLATSIVSYLLSGIALAAPGTVDVEVSGQTDEIDSGYSALYYGEEDEDSKLIGVDGSAATGGFRTWSLVDSEETLTELTSNTPGRTKVVEVLYDIAGKDLLVSITAPDSVLQLYDAQDPSETALANKKALGDWSSLCPWRSPGSGWQYFYLFGKKEAVQYIVRGTNEELEILEIQTFDIPVEPDSCAVSPKDGTVYFATEEKTIYSFQAEESTEPPIVTVHGEAEDDVTGLAVYVGSDSNYLLVAQEDIVDIYSPELELQGTINITGLKDIEIQDLSVYQGESDDYPAGVIAYAVESDDGVSYGISSLEDAFDDLELETNTEYSPRPDNSLEVSGSQENGFSNGNGTLSCFAGFTGPTCEEYTCRNDCSGHGDCIGPNECACVNSWTGPECAFIQVEAKYETDANGEDGDDPAIWISPASPNQSRIITTTKSDDDAGLAVFDLKGKQLQHMDAAEPNNVDVIYEFNAGNRTVDLAYTACRGDDTLCFFEITSEGLLAPISGGVQPTPEDFSVYGSCTYRSPTSGKQYLFINSKTAEYLQYELTSSANGTLSTTLVREFTGGSGSQPEGCVSDEENELLLLGEEASALWKYDAEPSSTEGTAIARVGDGTLFADVEGVTLVPGKTPEAGFIMVSGQGVSVYSVFRRAAPHEHVTMFTIGESKDGSIDAVTNTDGVAAVGTKLSEDFPQGLVVVHDDANELPNGDTSEKASFKMVSLADVLGNDEIVQLGLLDEVDESWNPRA